MNTLSSHIPTNPQEPPRYYGYHRYLRSGYASITECQKCGNVGLQEDCHQTLPCKHCGGTVLSAGAAIWIPPEYTGFLWWRRLVTIGYWRRAL